MLDIPVLLWFIPGFPLLAAIVTALFGPKFLRQYSHLPTILASAGSCAVSTLLLIGLLASGEVGTPSIGLNGYTWFAADVRPGFVPLSISDRFVVHMSLEIDSLSAIMLLAITFVGTFIAIFSSGYMKDDPGYPRYFAIMSLFLFSMTGLVMANNYLLLYAFWEGVGLCSYLLVGFWFQKPSAAAAARKAFLVTRLGDCGMILGIMLLWANFGHQFEFTSVSQIASINPDSPYLTAACLLLFCGAIGKSAQFPLHVWLPDAMEGPTPASALIHAATMVTAGVYLLARCAPLFVLSPIAQITVACVGGFTALLAALIALTQTDLKRVLAYSTVSQLGFMFLGLGAGLKEERLYVYAVIAAIFHLFTHAFFKALLFLGAGSIMHGMGHVIDMRRFGGLRKVMPVTHWTFLCGSLALAGLIPFSGFWSKDQIFETVQHAGKTETVYAKIYLILFGVALVTAALTAFYTFRVYFRTFWGELKIPDEAHHHHGHETGAHETEHHAGEAEKPHEYESPPVMTVPLMVLAVGAIAAGFLLEGATHWLSDFLVRSNVFRSIEGFRPKHHFDWTMAGLSTLSAGIGIGVAAYLYLGKSNVATRLATSLRSLHQFSQRRFLFDELYNLVVVKPLTVLAAISAFFDSLIDGIVDLAGHLPRFAARAIQPAQNGLVQFYALFMMVFLTALMVIFVIWVRQ